MLQPGFKPQLLNQASLKREAGFIHIDETVHYIPL